MYINDHKTANYVLYGIDPILPATDVVLHADIATSQTANKNQNQDMLAHIVLVHHVLFQCDSGVGWGGVESGGPLVADVTSGQQGSR